MFNAYIKTGGFPFSTELFAKDLDIIPYLEGLYATIVTKDIVTRESIEDINTLNAIIKTLAGSLGSTVSLQKITNTLKAAGRKVSINTIEKYIKALCDSYLFYKTNRFDVRGRQYLKTFGKYYIVDTGLRNLLFAQRSFDLGHQIEDIVFLELLRRKKKIFIGKAGNLEIDFVCQVPSGLEYYQVSASVLDAGTLERELKPLQKPGDNYPKYLLTLDEVGTGADYNGIRQLNLIDWLLSI
ncbi:MAG: ATP-binding protein [Spirochaetia bacterium]|nr:ATP-binding protein [Spirochaetia bacterium]